MYVNRKQYTENRQAILIKIQDVRSAICILCDV